MRLTNTGSNCKRTGTSKTRQIKSKLMTMSKTIEQHAKSGTARFILMDGGVALTQQLGKQNTFVVTRTIDLNKAFEYSSTSSVW